MPPVYARISWRILPILFVSYLFAYLNRVHVSFAKQAMMSSLGLDDAAYGFGAGLFFIGYFLCEVPSNVLLYRFGARRWIARIIFSWGILSAVTACVQNRWQYDAIRFVLGAAEAGFFPGIILYLTWWYPVALRTRIIALFITAIPAAGLVGGPISGWIMQSLGGVAGLRDWQWLFLLEGAPCLLVGVWVLRFLPDRPQDAGWLSAGDRQRVASDLERDARARGPGGLSEHPWSVFTLPAAWKLCLLYFCVMMGLYGLTFWLPETVKNLGWKSPLENGLASAVPWLAAVLFMVAYGIHSDRAQERRWHALVAALIAAAGFVGCGLLYRNGWVGLTAISVAAAGVMSLMAVQWALPTGLLGGAAAASGIALINSCGNLGGFFSPTLIGEINQHTGSRVAGQYLTAFFMVLAAVILLVCPSLQPPVRKSN